MKQRQKMSSKRKMAVVTAVVLVAALLVGGAFAWTDMSQSIINRLRGTADPDVLLHDDFASGVNKDVYVENTGNVDLVVRVRFDEFLQVGNEVIVGESSETPEKWVTRKFVSPMVPDAAGKLPTKNYHDWSMTGNEKVYKPGTGEMGNYTYTENQKFDDGTVAKKTLGKASVMTMEQWKASDKTAACWILDTDGWCYWSKLLEKGTATNLLLDNVTLSPTDYPDDNYSYFINVVLEASNKTEAKDLLPGASPDGEELIREIADLVDYTGLVKGGDGEYYKDLGYGVFEKYELDGIKMIPVDPSVKVVAGPDGVPATDDDGYIAGRTKLGKITDLAEGEIKYWQTTASGTGYGYVAVDLTDADTNVATATGFYYTVAGYKVYPGDDKKLGTFDDILWNEDASLGKWNYGVDGNSANLNYMILDKEGNDYLLISEFVLDQMVFNNAQADGNNYAGSVLQAWMDNFADKAGITKPIVETTLDMSKPTSDYVYVCTNEDASHTSHASGCTYGYAPYYSDETASTDPISGAKAFPLSINEAELYGGGNSSVESANIARRAKLAPSQIENTINYRRWDYTDTMYGFATGEYWLTSAGYYTTRASYVNTNGNVCAHLDVTRTTIGARPAMWVTL